MKCPIPRVVYDPATHTRKALLDQVETVLQHPDSPLLIGSLGRVAATGSLQEFRERGETSVRDAKGLARDIDLFFPGRNSLDLPAAPFPVDTGAVTAHDERIEFENGDYWLVDQLLGCAVRVDAEVFAPQRTWLLGDLEVSTFSPLTHYALLHVIYDNPRKYATARRLLREQIARSRQGARAELYEPFAEFHRRRHKSLLNHARRIYRRALPYELRMSLEPMMRRVKRRLDGRRPPSGKHLRHLLCVRI